jgi:hypothetical protein
MQQRCFGLTEEGLDKLHALFLKLLDLLKDNMPYRTGGPEGWNIKKAHSILYKVRDILLFGWSKNFSHQGPEHEHNAATLITASVWLIVQTTKRYISLYFTVGRSASWKRLRRHSAGPGQRKQALQGEHLLLGIALSKPSLTIRL